MVTWLYKLHIERRQGVCGTKAPERRTVSFFELSGIILLPSSCTMAEESAGTYFLGEPPIYTIHGRADVGVKNHPDSVDILLQTTMPPKCNILPPLSPQTERQLKRKP